MSNGFGTLIVPLNTEQLCRLLDVDLRPVWDLEFHELFQIYTRPLFVRADTWVVCVRCGLGGSR